MARIPVVDADCCIGCEACVLYCPEVFRMEEEAGHTDHGHGKSVVYNPAGATVEKIEGAMDRCPSACIYWS